MITQRGKITINPDEEIIVENYCFKNVNNQQACIEAMEQAIETLKIGIEKYMPYALANKFTITIDLEDLR